MESILQKYSRFLLVFMGVLCVLCVMLLFFSIRSADKVHTGQTAEAIYAIKSVFLKDTVQNMLGAIDHIRDDNRSRANSDITRIKRSIAKLWEKDRIHAKTISLALLTDSSMDGNLSIDVVNTDTKQTLYETANTGHVARYSDIIRFGPYLVRLGVNEDWVDTETKKEIADIIHTQKFRNGAYLWVNEIHNWKGGDNYAIRRIHPNLKDTEGDNLSTNTKDIKGNFPYLDELTGVRDHGEIYYSYFFKKLNSNIISKKLTYSTLYPDYNWIVSMGIYVDDIQTYIDAAKKSTAELTIRIAIIAALSLAVLFLAAFMILTRIETWYMMKASQKIRIESNTDPLTGALNRRIGHSYLSDSFRHFRHGEESPTIFSFDLDDFKKINDTYGHDAGDAVLVAVIAQIKKNMRSTDLVFRWGGEEFLLVCHDIAQESSMQLAEKLNQEIMSLPIEAGNKIIHAGISIGISRFSVSDSSPEAAIKRADEAMYEAKAAGKNCSRAKY